MTPRDAADAGHKDAQYDLDVHRLHGTRGFEKDEMEERALLERATACMDEGVHSLLIGLSGSWRGADRIRAHLPSALAVAEGVSLAAAARQPSL
jgi:hypothetical protein